MPTITEQLILHEGLKLKPYKDSEGFLTIGVGRNLEGKGITKEEALFLLKNDIDDALSNLEGLDWFYQLNYARQKVIIDMTVNLGFKGLLKFEKMIEAIKAKDFDRAAYEMEDSLWYRQVKTRAKRLIKMMKTGKDYK